MKRSEMVKLMGEWLASEYDQNIIKANTVAKGLLYFQEEAGMGPPRRVPEFTEYGEPNGFKIGECTWEPEDET